MWFYFNVSSNVLKFKDLDAISTHKLERILKGLTSRRSLKTTDLPRPLEPQVKVSGE